MGVRLEYLDVRYVSVAYVNELDVAVAENPEDRNVLVLSYDEAIAIVGSAEQLIDLAERMKAAVQAGPEPRNGQPPDEEEIPDA